MGDCNSLLSPEAQTLSRQRSDVATVAIIAAPTAAKTRKLAGHSAAILAVQVAVLFCSVGNNFLTARMGGPEGKGILYSLQLISSVLGLSFMHFCLGSAAIVLIKQGKASGREVAAAIFLPSLILGSGPALGLALGWHWFFGVAGGSIGSAYLWLAVLAIPAMVLTYNVSFFSLADDKLGQYNWLTAASPVVLAAGLCTFLILGKKSVPFLIAAWGLSAFVPACASTYLILKRAGGKLLPRYTLFRQMYQFGWRAHLCGVLQQLQHRSPVLLVGLLLPVASLGIYSLSVGLIELLWYIPNTLSVALLPHIAGSSREDASRVTPVICRVTLAVTAVLGVLLASFCSIVIPLILPRFTSALFPLWLLLPGVVISSIGRVIATDLNGRDKPLKVFPPVFCSLAVETALGIYCIPRYGLTGAALVTILGYLVNTALQIPIYCRIAGVAASTVLILHKQDVAAIAQLVRSRIEKLRELIAPEFAA